MRKALLTYENQNGLYQSKVTSSLASTQRQGHQAHNCKMDYSLLPQFQIKPLAHTTSFFIKDITHFLDKLNQLGRLPNNAILATLDGLSLYTNIPHNEGIDACCHYLYTRIRSTSTMRMETLCDLNRIIFTMNISQVIIITTTSKHTAQLWVHTWRHHTLTESILHKV